MVHFTLALFETDTLDITPGISQQKKMELSRVTLCFIVTMKILITLTLKPQLSYTADVLGGATYQFHFKTATIKPGPNAILSVTINDYGRCKLEKIMINRPVLIY